MPGNKLSAMPTEQIRETFIAYFENDHGHQRIEGAGIIPDNDPTLLFINSGMAALKPYFTEIKQPPHSRLTNAQTCIRTNDIEDVGDPHHGTSFTMLGNWSFGDYGKVEAMDMAVDLLTSKYGFDTNDLLATYYQEDPAKPGVPSDEISLEHWRNYLANDRILGASARDNFWGPAGTEGPCGPCTEVFFDRGLDHGDGEVDELGLENGRHVEIWNAGVFMEYEQAKDGSMRDLGRLCVDAGAGLERFAMILQDADSIHQIDQFLPAYDPIRKQANTDRDTRIIFDHLKTGLLITESGVYPSNQGAGYVLRKLLRRTMAIMDANGMPLETAPEIAESIDAVISHPPDATKSIDSAKDIIQAEAEKFAGILKRAEKFRKTIEKQGEITAKQAFDAVTSQGIPIDIVRESSLSLGVTFPEAELNTLIEEHRNTSRA